MRRRTLLAAVAAGASTPAGAGYPLGTPATDRPMMRAQYVADRWGTDFEPKNNTANRLGTDTATPAQIAAWKAMIDFLNVDGRGGNGRGLYRIRSNTAATPSLVTRWFAMMGKAGYQFCLDWDSGPSSSWNDADQDRQHAMLAPYCYALEGRNEYLNWKLTRYTTASGATYRRIGFGDASQEAVIALQIDIQRRAIRHRVPYCFLYTLGAPPYDNTQDGGPQVAASVFGIADLNALAAGAAGVRIGGPVHVYADGGYAMTDPLRGRMQTDGAQNLALSGGIGGLPWVASEWGHFHTPGGDNKGTPFVNARHILSDLIWAVSNNSFVIHQYCLVDYGPGYPGDEYWGSFDINGNPYQHAYSMRFYFGIIGDQGADKWTFHPGHFPGRVSGLRENAFTLVTQRSDGAVHLTICPQATFFAGGIFRDPGSSVCTVEFGRRIGTAHVYDPCTASDAYGGPQASQTISPNSNVAAWRSAPAKPAPIATYTDVTRIDVPLHLGPIVVEVMP